jgi:hypothetical protein
VGLDAIDRGSTHPTHSPVRARDRDIGHAAHGVRCRLQGDHTAALWLRRRLVPATAQERHQEQQHQRRQNTPAQSVAVCRDRSAGAARRVRDRWRRLLNRVLGWRF